MWFEAIPYSPNCKDIRWPCRIRFYLLPYLVDQTGYTVVCSVIRAAPYLRVTLASGKYLPWISGKKIQNAKLIIIQFNFSSISSDSPVFKINFNSFISSSLRNVAINTFPTKFLLSLNSSAHKFTAFTSGSPMDFSFAVARHSTF